MTGVTGSATLEPAGLLDQFHPVVRDWFWRRFPAGPTPAQSGGWPAIASGRHTLIAAPTGSGKTLAAFLVAIDRLLREGGSADGIRVVYVSPLKALAADIHHNLELPLEQMRRQAADAGQALPEIRVALRTGDTPAGERARLLKQVPSLLVTTPESLYLMLTAARTRELFTGVHTVIVDEVHALARDKRGSHLALSLERLDAVCTQAPTRVGLSATQRPIERIARLLVGAGPGRQLPVVVDAGHRRQLDLRIELPASELEAVAPHEQVDDVLARIAALVEERRTTLVFVNTRRLAERLAHRLAERLGPERVAAHHGSLSKERRQRIEQRLRSGDLSAVVATASLELGIDVGPVELVCQIGSPRSFAAFLQRVGRSGHQLGAVPVGRLYPLTRDELVECAALLRGVRLGQLDVIGIPVAPLDILAQQLVAECAAQSWPVDELFDLVRRALPYSELSRDTFERILDLLAEGVSTGRGRRGAFLHLDRIGGTVRARRGARLTALTSGGAIPDTADYRVLADPDDTFIGTVNEDWAIESMAGDVFSLGSQSWRIRRVERGVVRVVDADGAPPSIPFWLGEAPGRSAELSEAVSELRGVWADAPPETARSIIERECGVDPEVSELFVRYLDAGRSALGVVPTARDLVFERFFDDTGGMQVVLHAPLGMRLNRALGLLLRKRFCRSFDFELQAAANDDAVVLSLGPQHSFPLEELADLLHPKGIRAALEIAVLDTPMFGARWRWNLSRALLLPRMRGGKRTPPPIQRMEADDLTAAIFPALTACQDNAVGPREIPDHPLVQQTLHDCFTEAMDLEGLERLCQDVAAGRVRLHFRDTSEPSVFCHEILSSKPYTFLDDAPLEERRTQAVQLRRGLPERFFDHLLLDPDIVARVRDEAGPRIEDADELHDLLLRRIVCRPAESWAPLFEPLLAAGRAFVSTHGLWCASERRPLAEALVQAMSGADTELARQAAVEALRGHLESFGPVGAPELAIVTAIPEPLVVAALGELQRSGFVLRGTFEAGRGQQYCARPLLARMHARMRSRQRRRIEPVPAVTFVRFLCEWQGVLPGRRASGAEAVLRVIEQLQGVELPAGAWESEVLPARVANYRPEWLDQLCLGGQVVWGRISGRSSGGGAGALEAPSLQASRATPITLALRDDLPWLLGVRRRALPGDDDLPESTSRLLEELRRGGARFQSELGRDAALSAGELERALWDAVARGAVTADGFAALRELLASRRQGRAPGVPAWRRELRQVARGRWALLDAPALDADREELAEAWARQLLTRWGVVFYDLAAHEGGLLPWRELVRALRRFEDRGLVSAGRFVTGFVGEQFALPEAAAALRRVHAAGASGTVVDLSAADPLNLVGVIVPGQRAPSTSGRRVIFRDGAPLSDAPAETARGA